MYAYKYIYIYIERERYIEREIYTYRERDIMHCGKPRSRACMHCGKPGLWLSPFLRCSNSIFWRKAGGSGEIPVKFWKGVLKEKLETHKKHDSASPRYAFMCVGVSCYAYHKKHNKRCNAHEMKIARSTIDVCYVMIWYVRLRYNMIYC